MILDPDNKYIQAINSHAPLAGATILEIGCGTGRITGDMAEYAAKIVATDLDEVVLEQAKKNITAENVAFLHTPDGFAKLPEQSCDLVIYTLSLHHISPDRMVKNLHHSGTLLKGEGKIIVIEPGDGGSFLEVKERFGAGSGDESTIKAAAIAAMKNFAGWKLSPTYHFDVDFLFDDDNDFYNNKLPKYQELPAKKRSELRLFLQQHTGPRGIILQSERNLNLLTRKFP
ncbi:MAG: SAM-dependent methyltransferase [Deltaproteobacteria bacterium]|nr:MAG: SAM-dependent methyltransferase [Deltaproteobacteria bacterium]